jgi:hypothetical protein
VLLRVTLAFFAHSRAGRRAFLLQLASRTALSGTPSVFGVRRTKFRIPVFLIMFKPFTSEKPAELLFQPGLEYWFKERRTLNDFRRGPLGPHFDGFAAYLKARSLAGTEVYLHATAELLESVGKRFHSHFAIPAHNGKEGYGKD